MLGLFNQLITDYQNVHFGSQEAVDGLLRLQDDWLIVIERSIKEDRDTGDLFEFFYQRPIHGVRSAADRLQTA